MPINPQAAASVALCSSRGQCGAWGACPASSSVSAAAPAAAPAAACLTLTSKSSNCFSTSFQNGVPAVGNVARRDPGLAICSCTHSRRGGATSVPGCELRCLPPSPCPAAAQLKADVSPACHAKPAGRPSAQPTWLGRKLIASVQPPRLRHLAGGQAVL